jgi:UDP-galactopyranose mutase
VISESEGEILFSKLWVHRYAYPLHTIQSNKARERLMEFIRESGVMVLGRWGTWRYLNTDKILEESLRLVTNINSR